MERLSGRDAVRLTGMSKVQAKPGEDGFEGATRVRAALYPKELNFSIRIKELVACEDIYKSVLITQVIVYIVKVSLRLTLVPKRFRCCGQPLIPLSGVYGGQRKRLEALR